MNTIDKLTVLKLLQKGRDPGFTARATGLPEALIQTVADGLGWPTLDQVTLKGEIQTLEQSRLKTIPVRDPDPTPPPPRVVVAPPPVAAPTSRPAPKPAASTPPAHAPAPGGTLNGAPPPTPSVEELLRACRRSDSKRTQALGPKLAELAERITNALREERETAEAKAQRAQEVAAAQAEVKRLERELAAARAKAVAAGAPGGVRGGPRACDICGDQLATPQALGAHKRHKHGIPSTKGTSA